MPQQREYSICITLLSPPGVDAQKRNQTFLLVLSRLAAVGNTALCQIKRPARFTNGLEAPDRVRLEMPAALPECRCSGPFSSLVVGKAKRARGGVTKKQTYCCFIFNNLQESPAAFSNPQMSLKRSDQAGD
jgi:hypothetical protein